MAGPNDISDPLANFQARMNQILAQANAQLQQSEHDLQAEFHHQEAQIHQPSSNSSAPGPPSYAAHPTSSTTLATAPLTCEGRNPVSSTHWYGWPDCCICTHCFTTFAANTPLAYAMPFQGEFVSSHTTCDLYSPRQRARYLEACKTRDVEPLLAASRERSVVWQETVGVILGREAERDLARAKAQTMDVSAAHNAMIERYSGLKVSFGDEVRDEWRTDSGGVYSSWNGVVAEREGKEAEELWTEAANLQGGNGELIAKLEARWAAVE
ncbi:hypothetical protein B0T14DRAFT_508593 [Immersiella caudata]|uniref:Uncharacterized protein n=1 Tax=Immersiella caudata TaxID=314043 RepID=A0AA40C549_9PEZI|nr:hypothetical protein B0T14DRAFT_508593 [Immersiella caudata]